MLNESSFHLISEFIIIIRNKFLNKQIIKKNLPWHRLRIKEQGVSLGVAIPTIFCVIVVSLERNDKRVGVNEARIFVWVGF